MALVIVITLDPEGKIALRMPGFDQNFPIVIEVQLQLECGEETLHHPIVPVAALGGHAADDLLRRRQEG